MSHKSNNEPLQTTLSGDILTSQDLVIIVQKVTGDSLVKVLKHHLEPYSVTKLGFVASHQLLSITIQRKSSNCPENLNLFVKAVPYGCQKQLEYLNDQGFFAKESLFFDVVIPKLTENYTDEKWSPICYLAKEDVIVMEDLRSQNYKMLGKFFDKPAPLKSVLATLARFHACSIVAEDRMNQNSELKKGLNEYYPKCCKETTFETTGMGKLWFSAGAEIVNMVAESLGYRSQSVSKALNCVFDLVKPSKIHRNVFCHGDLWTNNIMFSGNDNEPLKSVLVDFQVLRYGPIVLDILFFIHLYTSIEFRRKYEKDYIEYYYSILEETARKSDVTKTAKIPTLEEIHLALDDLRLFGMICACLYHQIVHIDSEFATECTKSSDDFENYVFRDRKKIVLSYMKKDVVFKRKLEEAVTELSEYSQICYK